MTFIQSVRDQKKYREAFEEMWKHCKAFRNTIVQRTGYLSSQFLQPVNASPNRSYRNNRTVSWIQNWSEWFDIHDFGKWKMVQLFQKIIIYIDLDLFIDFSYFCWSHSFLKFKLVSLYCLFHWRTSNGSLFHSTKYIKYKNIVAILMCHFETISRVSMKK